MHNTSPTLRDLCGALPTIKYNIKSLNPMGIVLLALFFLSTCIVVSLGAWVYAAIGNVLS